MTKEEIFKKGTKEYCSPLHAVRMYSDGNCPFNCVEAAISSAMDAYVTPALQALRHLRHGIFKDEAAVNQLIDETINNYNK